MAFQSPDEGFRRDRSQHGGAPEHLDDDRLAHEAEDERVEAGIDPYNPDDVPPATDTPALDTDIRDTEEYEEERAEIKREEDKDELLIRGEREQFPPTHYEELRGAAFRTRGEGAGTAAERASGGPAGLASRAVRDRRAGSSMTTPPGWDDAYTEERRSPWDIGRPQPVFVHLADRDLLSGQVLDAGCGTGEQALLAAERGARAMGVDVSPRAIGRARAKAAERDLAARFEVADALNLVPFGLTFDTVIDCGLFHVFDDEARARYVASLASVLDPGGTCYLMCFSDRQPGDFGPRRVSQDELRSAFSDGWAITDITAGTFKLNPGLPIASAQSWLATIRRT